MEDGINRRLAILDDNHQRVPPSIVVSPRLARPEHDHHVDIRSIPSPARGDAADHDRGASAAADQGRQPALEGVEALGQPPVFIARASVTTDEPHLRAALATGISLWDPEHLVDDEPETSA